MTKHLFEHNMPIIGTKVHGMDAIHDRLPGRGQCRLGVGLGLGTLGGIHDIPGG